MIATHIIQVAGFGVADAVNICNDSYPFWRVETITGEGFLASPADENIDSAIAKWNAAFSKAPFQHQGSGIKGKACE